MSIALCEDFLTKRHGATAFLTPSCTAALELAGLAIGLQEGDEVVIPSFSFPSCSNSVLLHRATPVYVDVRLDTLNLDERQIYPALSKKTKAILPIHYAGVSCDMGAIRNLARAHDLYVIEDAAQCVGAWECYQIGAMSFHTTKNVECGEGGAIFVKDPELLDRVLRQRNCGFIYNPKRWVDLGYSALLGEPAAEYLWKNLQRVDDITSDRRRIWGIYSRNIKAKQKATVVGTGHIFWFLAWNRDGLIKKLEQSGITAMSHYEAAHLCPPGKRGRRSGSLLISEHVASHIVRLPTNVTETQALRTVEIVNELLGGRDGDFRRVETQASEQGASA